MNKCKGYSEKAMPYQSLSTTYREICQGESVLYRLVFTNQSIPPGADG